MFAPGNFPSSSCWMAFWVSGIDDLESRTSLLSIWWRWTITSASMTEWQFRLYLKLSGNQSRIWAISVINVNPSTLVERSRKILLLRYCLELHTNIGITHTYIYSRTIAAIIFIFDIIIAKSYNLQVVAVSNYVANQFVVHHQQQFYFHCICTCIRLSIPYKITFVRSDWLQML